MTTYEFALKLNREVTDAEIEALYRPASMTRPSRPAPSALPRTSTGKRRHWRTL